MKPARWFAFATLATSLAIMALVSSQHRMRLIFGSYQTVDSLADMPANADFRYMTDTMAADPPFDAVVRELAAFDVLHPVQPGDALPALDNPDTCERLLREGKPVHCYNADIGVCSMLGREHVLSRLWDLSGPTELGGNGHNLIDIFDRSSHTWKALDPYYHCYFTLASDTLQPLSVPEFRRVLLANPGNVRLIRYDTTPQERPDSIVLAEFRFLLPCAMLHSNNDFTARYNERYGWLMPFSGILDRLPLRAARGVRTLMLGANDSRFMIQDAYSPHYSFRLLHDLFWSLIIAFGIFFTLGVIFIRKEKKDHALRPAR